jgi:hypothetical protein
VTATTDGFELPNNADLNHLDLAAPAELRKDDGGQEKGEAGFGSDSDPGDTLPIHDDT